MKYVKKTEKTPKIRMKLKKFMELRTQLPGKTFDKSKLFLDIDQYGIKLSI